MSPGRQEERPAATGRQGMGQQPGPILAQRDDDRDPGRLFVDACTCLPGVRDGDCPTCRRWWRAYLELRDRVGRAAS